MNWIFASHRQSDRPQRLVNGSSHNDDDKDPSLALVHRPLSESSMVEQQVKMGLIAPFSEMRQLGGQPQWRSGSASQYYEKMSEAERISESERHRALCTSIDSF